MANITKWWKEFQAALSQNDTQKAETLKKQILESPLRTPEDVQSKFHLALALSAQKTTEAFLVFAEISGADIPCFETQQARIAYAMALHAQKKSALGIFELRKVISSEPKPSITKALALDYLSLFLRETNATAEQISEIDSQRIQTLEALLPEQAQPEDRDQLNALLAAALEERGHENDRAKALLIHQQLAEDPKKVSKRTYTAAKEALRRLSQPRRK